MTFYSDTDDVDLDEIEDLGIPSTDADFDYEEGLDFSEANRPEVDQAAMTAALAPFRGTRLVDLITATETLRQYYGPADPTVADLCEDIQSSLTELMLSLRSAPLGFVAEILVNDPSQLPVLKNFIADWEKRNVWTNQV